MRQKVGDDVGDDVEGRAAAAAERPHNGASLIAGAPGQLVGTCRAALAGVRTAFAPFADGLGRDAVALG